ncbi:glycine cleavage system aminomethyltransferase GcvT [Candidatus Bathyarchaeota archaeon]|nr:glycine cleavage system aminomethyltransferase GcvT [Candidatus Bathyarchaeota archaeon]
MINKTQIYEFHKENGKLIEFAGFEMPVWYKGIIQECLAVRNAAGIFDVSHMGRAFIYGEEDEEFLNYLTPIDVSMLKPGIGHYSVMCNEQGGIIDDLILLKLEDKFLMVFNASNRVKDLSWMQKQTEGFKVKIDHVSEQIAMFAIQGPKAREIVQKIAKENVYEIPRFGVGELTLNGVKCFASGTGYTGEDGFEIFVLDASIEKPQNAFKVWNSLLKAGESFGLEPCGLGSRDVLRLEAGMCLYGSDIDESTTPFEAKISWVVKLNKKSNFIGRKVLEKQKAEGIKRCRIGLKLKDKGIPRHGYEILKDNEIIGKVTSGTLSPILNIGVAMGYVPVEYANIGEALQIKIRDKLVDAEVVNIPFYDTAKYGWKREK